MSYSRNLATYQETKVMSSSPEQLVPLLYEHLLVNLKRSQKQIREREIEAKVKSVEKALDILYELLACLDFEGGGEIASRLASLYSYFLKEIGEASRELDPQRFDPIIEMIASLHESWQEATRLVSTQEAEGGGGGEAGAGEGAI